MKPTIRQINRLKRWQNEQRHKEDDNTACRTWVAKIRQRTYTGHSTLRLK
jgi:hypothetical protein